jgi:hypothetical protein
LPNRTPVVDFFIVLSSAHLSELSPG